MSDTSNTTTATLTIRLIRSFEYSNIKLMVLPDTPLDMKPDQLEAIIKDKIQKQSQYTPLRNMHLDTFKIFHKAHSFKSGNLTINLEDDDKLILQKDKTLKEHGIEDECEISYFVREDYEKFKQHPEHKWEPNK